MENNKYQNSKIYKICDINETEIYIGSTHQSLTRRFSKHKSNYKAWKDGKYGKNSSCILFEKYGIENCKIYLIENYPCNNREELNAREGYHIKLNNCVNKVIAGRTKQQWRQDNPEIIKKIYDNRKGKFECYLCDSILNHSTNWIRHLKQKNHINNEKILNDVLNGLYD